MKLSTLVKIYLTPKAIENLLKEAEEICTLINQTTFSDSCVFTQVELDKKHKISYRTCGIYFAERNEFSVEQFYGSFYWKCPEPIKCSREYIFEALALDAVKNIANLDHAQRNLACVAPYIILWKEKMKAAIEIA